MYIYDEFDRTFVAERAAQFREQVARRLSGGLTEEEFKPLRLMNGVYLQLHAYMLRIAIPYGTLSSKQLRKLAHVARVYDRGYGHFTTRQNLQLNWIKLSDMPQVLKELAEAGFMPFRRPAIASATSPPTRWGGVAPDEIEDPATLGRNRPSMVHTAPGIFAFCPANSRSRSQERRTIAPP